MKRTRPNLRPADGISPKGRVEIFVSRGAPKLKLYGKVPNLRGRDIFTHEELDFSSCQLLSSEVIYNIIVNTGKDKVIQSLADGFLEPIMRMAVGDRGTIPSDPTIPKVPTATQSGLYNEIYRDDIDATILNVGTPTIHEVKFVKTFSSLLIPITAFSNQAIPVVNEVGLITAGSSPAFPRPPVAAPNAPEADEKLFSIRTFKTVPFEAANEISVTIRYTIFIE